ncbi:hypothetical protein RIF29_09685 [Crotalaria pallida]|uniref:Uncharacterized protein n=1 Tax=Crotalaria pallida TaxID=3830 RepID=A0AAN9II09_CROPI
MGDVDMQTEGNTMSKPQIQEMVIVCSANAEGNQSGGSRFVSLNEEEGVNDNDGDAIIEQAASSRNFIDSFTTHMVYPEKEAIELAHKKNISLNTRGLNPKPPDDKTSSMDICKDTTTLYVAAKKTVSNQDGDVDRIVNGAPPWEPLSPTRAQPPQLSPKIVSNKTYKPKKENEVGRGWPPCELSCPSPLTPLSTATVPHYAHEDDTPKIILSKSVLFGRFNDVKDKLKIGEIIFESDILLKKKMVIAGLESWEKEENGSHFLDATFSSDQCEQKTANIPQYEVAYSIGLVYFSTYLWAHSQANNFGLSKFWNPHL